MEQSRNRLTGSTTHTAPLNFIQGLRERHQARAQAAARTGVIPEAFADDPAFLNLVATFSEAPLAPACSKE